MAITNHNEITIRVLCTEKELLDIINKQKFDFINEYNATDIFMIPNNLDIYTKESREILKSAILLREFKGISSDKHKMKITFKDKEIDKEGNIISQYSVNCEIKNIEDAKELFKHIGYKELMKIDERHFSYEKNNFKIIIKILSEKNILIEAETNDYFDTIDKLKEEMKKTTVPFDTSNYFVKKAEEELNKIKNNV